MTLLLFHGTEILGFLAGIALGISLVVGILAWILLRPPVRAFIPATIYLSLAIIACVGFTLIDRPGIDFLPDANYFLMLPVALCFPWSLLTIILSGYFDQDLGSGPMILGAFFNSFVIYSLGKLAKRRLDTKLSSIK